MQRSDSNPTHRSESLLSAEPIAIIGIGCRFPGGVHDLDTFWQLLKDGVDAISEVPSSRFDLSRYYDPRPATPGKIISRLGGFLNQIDEFDAYFFGISPREAERIDPQQRLLLELSWEALEDAGQPLDKLIGSQTGVYIAQWLNDFEARLFANPGQTDFYMTTGSGRYTSSGRLSYFYGLQGPSLTVDSHCSSSLVAVHLACQSLRTGESKMALAGAVNIILQPQISIAYSQSKMLSPDGRCKFGDARANGYVRSEGAAVIVLKRLSDALADHDPIHALILGSAVNNDGQSSGFLATPGGEGQVELLRKSYQNAGIKPGVVQYIEAHGTGTPAGDPVEIGALGSVLNEGRSQGNPCHIGSVKTNIGHTEGAAGLAGLIKVVLSLTHEQLPPSLHFQDPNPAIPWDMLPLKIQNKLEAWPEHDGPAIGGVSAFGIAGTNAHVVLGEFVQKDQPTELTNPVMSTWILPLSARTPEALRLAANQYAEYLAHTMDDLTNILYTASQRRTHHEYRLVARGDSQQGLVEALHAYSQGEEPESVTIGQFDGRRKVVFVFPGQGSQWLGMGRQLYQKEPVFRKTIHQCEAAFEPFLDWSLSENLFAPEGHLRQDDIDVVQPTLFAIEVALAELWRARGVEPDAVVGHSMGEVAAAFIAGVLNLSDAARVICTRSRLMKRLSGNGAMAVVELTMDQARTAIAGYEDRLSIAVSNGKRSTVLSGDPDALALVTKDLQDQGVFFRFVKVDVAAHSPHMDSIRPELVTALEDIRTNKSNIPIYSTVTGGLVSFALDAEYWGMNLREPVLFSDAVEASTKDGYTLYIECSPHPILLSAIEPGDPKGKFSDQRITIASLLRGEDELATFYSNLARVHCEGGVIHWERNYPQGHCVVLPAYPWQRERFWLKEAELSYLNQVRLSAGFLGEHFELSAQPGVHIWQSRLSLEAYPYLADHRVGGAVVLPAAAIAEFAMEVVGTLESKYSIENIEFLQSIELQQETEITFQLILNPDLSFVISSRDEAKADWVMCVKGLLTPQQDSFKPALEEIVEFTDNHTGGEHIANMHARGLYYGPAFQSVVSYQKNGINLQAEVCLPDTIGLGGHVLHPILLDASFQLLISTLADSEASGEAYLPVKIDQLKVITSPQQYSPLTVTVTRRISSSSDHLIGDILLKDELGQVLLVVKGLVMQRSGQVTRRLEVPEAPHSSGIIASLLAVEVGRSRHSLMENFIQEQAAQVLRLPAARVSLHKPLRTLGMDSLMTMEFRNRLEVNLGLVLSASLVWNYPTITELVPYLADKAGIPLDNPPNSSGSQPGVETLTPDETISSEIDRLSDEEVANLLTDELDQLDKLLKDDEL